MDHMTEYRPDSATNHDYIPAAGHDALLPGYDLLMRLLGMNTVYEKLIAQAELVTGCACWKLAAGPAMSRHVPSAPAPART